MEYRWDALKNILITLIIQILNVPIAKDREDIRILNFQWNYKILLVLKNVGN